MSMTKPVVRSSLSPRKVVSTRRKEPMHTCTGCLARYPNTREYFTTASRSGLLRADCRWCCAARAHQQAAHKKRALGLPVGPYRPYLPKKPASFVATPVKPVDKPLLKPAPTKKSTKKPVKRSPGVVKRKATTARRKAPKKSLSAILSSIWFLRPLNR